MQYSKILGRAGLLLVACFMLTACGSLSNGIADNGLSADEIVWPDVSDTTPMHDGGTFPTADNLHQIHPGMTKNQIMKLIGPPHFSEGVWNVREWNYVFSFRNKDDPSQWHICQYKVFFDTDALAQSFYWKPKSCAKLTQSAPIYVAVDSFDVLFDFDKSAFNHIHHKGQEELQHLAAVVKTAPPGDYKIELKGYTDRLGDHAYNKALSQRRADTVRAYLISNGAAASDIEQTQGLGKTTIYAQCENNNHSDLVSCLTPNRRVTVTVKHNKNSTTQSESEY